jgi:hypothetical protein
MTRLATIVLCGLCLIGSACGPNQRIINSAQEIRDNSAPAPGSNIAPAQNSFERDLNAMRNADFSFIYVFRRRDGGVLDADDKSFITSTSPEEMNRRTLSDEGKALIIGSNFRMPPASLDAFKQRFVFEDFSKGASDTVNANR